MQACNGGQGQPRGTLRTASIEPLIEPLLKASQSGANVLQHVQDHDVRLLGVDPDRALLARYRFAELPVAFSGICMLDLTG